MKLEAEHSEAITFAYLRYCMRDVQCTFELYQSLRAAYKKKGLKRPITSIFSPASIGKGLYEEIGITPFLNLADNIDPKVIGIFMEGYVGARSEVHVRHEIVEVQYLDANFEHC